MPCFVHVDNATLKSLLNNQEVFDAVMKTIADRNLGRSEK